MYRGLEGCCRYQVSRVEGQGQGLCCFTQFCAFVNDRQKCINFVRVAFSPTMHRTAGQKLHSQLLDCRRAYSINLSSLI